MAARKRSRPRGTSRRARLTLIVPDAQIAPEETVDRGGGRRHSLGGRARKLVAKVVDEEAFRDSLSRTLDQVVGLFEEIGARAVEGWKVEQISVSLGVSAEGSIGIATAGAETSIEVSFGPR
jgi:hypothetical protein